MQLKWHMSLALQKYCLPYTGIYSFQRAKKMQYGGEPLLPIHFPTARRLFYSGFSLSSCFKELSLERMFTFHE